MNMMISLHARFCQHTIIDTIGLKAVRVHDTSASQRGCQREGFSQGRLSRVANIDENTLKRIYRDPYAIITTETLDKLARALGVPSSELIEDVPDK